MSHADIERSLALRLAADPVLSRRVYALPEHFVSGLARKEVLAYLQANHCYDAVRDGRADVRYDPKQHRVVFLVKQDGEIYDAVGRALARAITPKWWRYNSSGAPFMVMARDDIRQVRNTICVVEDCASACSASAYVDSCALLGSQLGLVDVPSLVPYRYVIVAMDKDAGDKSIQMQRYLSFFCPDVRMMLLERDLKYLEKEEIKDAIAQVLPDAADGPA